MRNIISKVINLKVVLQCTIQPGIRFASVAESSLDRETRATRGDRQGDGDIGQQITWLVGQSGMPINHNARWRGYQRHFETAAA